MMIALRILEAETILMSYWLVSVIFVLLKKYFGEKFWKYMQSVLIMTRKQKVQFYFLSRYKIKCIGQIAKNYLIKKEIDVLNKLVTAYLDIAEVQALNQEPMYMKDWLKTVDDYLKEKSRRKSFLQ